MASSEKDSAVAAAPSDAPIIYWPSRASAIPINQAEETPVKDSPSSSSSSSHCSTPDDAKVETPGNQLDKAGRTTRGKNYSPREDENICKAWLVISQDPVLGANQQTDEFFEQLAEHFGKHNKEGPARSVPSVKARWSQIKRACAKFTSSVATVKGRSSQADKVERAKEMWWKDNGGKPFLFEKCWRILKDSPKWWAENVVIPTGGAVLDGREGSTARLEGRKKSKVHVDSSSPSFATTSCNSFEMKNQEMLEDKEEKRKVREAKKAAFEAQRNFFENQKIEADRRREEADRRREEEDKRREEADRRREEADIRKEENAILAIKVEGLDEESKTYIIEQKQNILARRKGFNPTKCPFEV